MNLRLASLALLFLPALGFAQDMPLFTIVKSGEMWKPATGERPKTPSSWVDTSPDGGTVYQANGEIGFLYASSASNDPKAAPGIAPYAQLRIEQGYDNGKAAQDKRKKDPPKIPVTSVMVDAQGRIYAGTKLGIQVFDPTGRLCGVLALPAAGDPEHLGWEGDAKDRLVVWIGDKKFVRAMQATGKR